MGREHCTVDRKVALLFLVGLCFAAFVVEASSNYGPVATLELFYYNVATVTPGVYEMVESPNDRRVYETSSYSMTLKISASEQVTLTMPGLLTYVCADFRDSSCSSWNWYGSGANASSVLGAKVHLVLIPQSSSSHKPLVITLSIVIPLIVLGLFVLFMLHHRRKSALKKNAHDSEEAICVADDVPLVDVLSPQKEKLVPRATSSPSSPVLSLNYLDTITTDRTLHPFVLSLWQDQEDLFARVNDVRLRQDIIMNRLNNNTSM